MNVRQVSGVSFQRKPMLHEMKIYTNSLNDGLKLLNKQVDVIIHNSSAPSVPSENVGIGSLFSKTTFNKLMPFLKSHAITGIQQEPNGIRKLGDFSPYSPESSAKNIFVIPLEKLASSEYNNLLSKETFRSIVTNRPKGNNVDYKYVSENFEKALKEAYENFKEGDFLKKEFADFKAENGEKYEKYAIFRILDSHYKKGWEEWDGIDKKLFSPQNNEEKSAAKKRITELKSKYQDEIDFYIFKQMLVEKENVASNANSSKHNITIIGDSPVATPAADEWIHQHLFLQGKALGCPPDYFSPEGQRWGFKYFDPEKIFNKDGSLGEAGLILRKKYEDYFASFPGGLRIDHVIGLVDPFIYTTAEKMTAENSGRIYSKKGSQYKKHGKEYENILRQIVLPAAEKYGIDTSSIICEDLGEVTRPTAKAMKNLNLSGIAVTQYDYRGATTPEKDLIMLGSHDNVSYLEFVEDLFSGNQAERFGKKTYLLAEDTAPKNATAEDIQKYADDIRADKKKFIAASFAELFASPARRIQIFFTDLFGIPKTYNRPGTTEGNWSLRIGENFENDYYKAVSEGKAPNFAQIIATALRHRGLDKGNEALLTKLDNSAKILAEA